MATLHRLHNIRNPSLHHYQVIRTSSNHSLVRHSGTHLPRMHLLHHLDNIKPLSRHHYRVINISSSPCLVLRSRTPLLPMLHPHHQLDYHIRQHLFSKVSVYPASHLFRHPFLARAARPQQWRDTKPHPLQHRQGTLTHIYTTNHQTHSHHLPRRF